ncbi:MAG TPA: C25 family cysteine peptidase, partial [Cytophagaceae bacterium]
MEISKKLPKSFVLIFLCFVGREVFSQKERIVLNWESPKTILTSEGEKRVLSFDGAMYGEFNYLPQLQFSFPNQENLETLNFSDLQYADLPEEEIAFLPKNFTIDTLYFSGAVAYQAHAPIFLLNILPFRFNKISKKFEKVLSFSYSCTFRNKERPVIKRSTSGREEGGKSQPSVLSEGVWHKLEISKTGIYKIDAKYLASLGISFKDVDPKNIRLYGNGGGMLPQANSEPRTEDLVENAIKIVGEEDGKFDADDYILFYGEGPDKWKYDSSEHYFNHVKNLYSDYSYYFLTISATPGSRIEDTTSLSESGNQITEFDEYASHELDVFNLFNSGRKWFGEQFNSTSTTRNVSLSCEGIVPGSSLKIKYSLMALHSSKSYFSLTANGFSLGQVVVPSYAETEEYPQAQVVNTLKLLNASNIENKSRIDIRLDYRITEGTGAKGALDYISLNYKKQLKLYDKETFFRSTSSKAFSIADFIIQDAPLGMQVWDITDPHRAKNILYTRSNNKTWFTSTTTAISEYVLLNGSDFPTPKFVGRVANQNLHGISEVPNFVIVAPNEFYSQAQQLANYREANDGLKTIVVTTNQIY